jgi:uncharacterized ubiquitin-like protein YukD
VLGETETKKRLDEANRVIRDQGSSVAYPPMNMSSHPPPAPTKPRLEETSQPTMAPPKSLLPPPPPATVIPENPFAAAATAATTSTTSTTTTTLLSEADFIASLPRPEVTLQIRIPNDAGQMVWNFYGQIVSLQVSVQSTIKTIKTTIATQHLNGMPWNKIQLKHVTTGAFLKDSASLAALNIGPTATLELVPKIRGGRR